MSTIYVFTTHVKINDLFPSEYKYINRDGNQNHLYILKCNFKYYKLNQYSLGNYSNL